LVELKQLGMETFLKGRQIVETSYEIGRVSFSSNGLYRVIAARGEVQSRVSGKFYYETTVTRDFPCVGDWVLFEPLPGEAKGIIHDVLERKSLLSRHGAGEKNEEQLIAANVDTVFLVSALNQDFNLRRMERYLTQVYQSGANPVFLLTKKDLCEDLDEKLKAVESIAFGVPTLAIDALHNEGLVELQAYIFEGQTVSLIGSSGVGKSTIVNQLLGQDFQKTQAVREEDARGRHTTTHRELFVLPTGGVVIDTPGMRELQLWTGEESARAVFDEIEALSEKCRFRDCEHRKEPGCAVREAIESGELDQERYQSYVKLQREAAFVELKEKYGTSRATRIQSQRFRKLKN